MKRKWTKAEIALIITSVLFVLSIFLGKWVLLTCTLAWLICVGHCMNKMIKSHYSGIGEFVSSIEKMGERNYKEAEEEMANEKSRYTKSQIQSQKARGVIEYSIVPIMALAGFGIICALLSIVLL